jgi:hypothetical protein
MTHTIQSHQSASARWATGTYPVKNEPMNAPTAPVEAKIRKG